MVYVPLSQQGVTGHLDLGSGFESGFGSGSGSGLVEYWHGMGCEGVDMGCRLKLFIAGTLRPISTLLI